MNSNQMRGKAIDAFNSFAGTADLYAVERMPRTYAGRPFLLTYLLGTGTKIRCPFSWPHIFGFIALIGWFFQKSIHKFIQALLAYRRQEAQPQSSLHDAEAAENL
ncbi:hypothetical protein M441DRAFT_233711 [Trichoderma asperellum CBS 433.97]|uniref:Uncharacterized protein n=1 Tax=Trichoderma asperellum (strain ATCC 204424 / CBS 433.97 / NBRC 101777) TaxID=1042311 RepID=A0A2T3ZR00_TRIA4|nr:hypothetical protein M441DRAFT_233711 [Trichoderma asperellum CBS 433.97]PTB47225.1 hypothetical protein M441DRAFT_233711 [Trichoderma asperellum CBS 433.97]